MPKSSIIVYDWDDTLFPTTHIQNANFNLWNPIISLEERHFFQSLDESISNLLLESMRYAKVVIVTNASRSWFDRSLLFLYGTRNVVSMIEIISAQDVYGRFQPMCFWKDFAFRDLITRNPYCSELVSIGDSDYEREATIGLERIKKMMLKVAKFHPTENIEVFVRRIIRLRNDLHTFMT